MNLVLIILDSWRQDHCGCYGNEWIHTPHLDALAAQSAVFTRCYPESLPTLPVRRALHTGRRVYPFRDHWLQKGDFVGAPGWGPIPEEQETVAELLQGRGYRTAFITDAYHQFKPSKNFHRGFDEWQWIRGQENDPYRSGPAISEEQLARVVPASVDTPGFRASHAQYLRNVAGRRSEEDYFPAQVFRGGADWLGRNQEAEKFFLVLDSFDPHEPWDPPAYYRKLYDPEDLPVDVIWSTYGAADAFTERELQRMRANYAGEVTLVDRWLGHFLQALDDSGRAADTVVGLISDHGHNLGDSNLTGKQGHPLTRAVADLIMMIRPPVPGSAGGSPASGGSRRDACAPGGTRCDALCYNYDLTTTLLSMIGEGIPEGMEGRDLGPVLRGEQPGRDHVTVAWGPDETMIDDKWWCNALFWGDLPLVYDLETDPQLTTNVAADHPEVVARAVELFRQDAGGDFPEYLKTAARMPGCTPLL
jgi:arylsulfatase A-like enzyme